MNDCGNIVFIIGAPRSGTNLLRDLICENETCITWPCDEINGIWRYGNVHLKDDEIGKVRATRRIKAFIRNAFRDFWRNNATHKSEFLIEKTCANSLRIDFLREVFPDARFVVIFRDGRDVFRSSKRRWSGEFELRFWPYLLKKVRYTPVSVLFFMGFSFVRARFRYLFSGQKFLKVWGPTISEFSAPFYNLEDKIALQWCKCVERTIEILGCMREDEFITLRYENLVSHTDSELARVFNFLGMSNGSIQHSRGINIQKPRASDGLPPSVSPNVCSRVSRCQHLIDGFDVL